MKTTLLTTAALISALASFGQNDKSKKVESAYLSLPAYDISATDPATISIDFAMKDGVFGTEKLKEGESTCMPKGGTIKDAVKIKAYHYEIPYTEQESYVVARSGDGTIVYAEKSSNANPSVIRFGWDEKMKQALCEYAFTSDKLKKDWASQGNSFKQKEHSQFQNSVYNRAVAEAKANVSLSYMDQEFEVYTAKGKTYDYTALDEAFEKAMTAYESIKKNGLNTSDIDRLKECITTWEKELGSIDTEDNKARITKDIGKGLHENCARAYFYMMDFDNSKIHAEKFKALFGNFSNNRTQAFDQLLLTIHLQKVAAAKNAAILSDVAALHAKASSSKGGGPVNLLPANQFETLQSDFYKFKGSQASGLMEEKKKEEDALVASGELNPYQRFYFETAVGGAGILMNLPPSPLSGTPEISSFPLEICEFTEAKQVVILKNKVASIPEEIANMTELTKLDLSGNLLTTLPSVIGSLSNLETLKLNDNPIESLPAEIGNLSNLKTLQIKGTKLSQQQIDEVQKMLPDCKIKN